jgi:hypothetical protein
MLHAEHWSWPCVRVWITAVPEFPRIAHLHIRSGFFDPAEWRKYANTCLRMFAMLPIARF